MSDSPLIDFHDVHKAFGPKVVYRGLNLQVFRGETLTILGGSGVGKSVMLKMLIGLLPVDKGEVRFDGQLVGSMGPPELAKLRQRVGMVFQSGALFDSISVGDNVAYGLREHFADEMNEKQIQERVDWALDAVGMPNIQSMAPSDLSGGMKKRVGVARTIALHPEVILYDEPTTGLDPVNTTRMNHLIMRLKRVTKATSIVVTHDMSTAFAVSDRLAFVYKGIIAESGNRQHFRNTTNPIVQDFVEGRSPDDEDLAAVLGR